MPCYMHYASMHNAFPICFQFGFWKSEISNSVRTQTRATSSPQNQVASLVAVYAYELRHAEPYDGCEPSRELRHPPVPPAAVAEYDLITHFLAAMRASFRRVCGTNPTGAICFINELHA